jgi:hypothetical protein
MTDLLLRALEKSRAGAESHDDYDVIGAWLCRAEVRTDGGFSSGHEFQTVTAA